LFSILELGGPTCGSAAAENGDPSGFERSP
jgi:hypothetical protein